MNGNISARWNCRDYPESDGISVFYEKGESGVLVKMHWTGGTWRIILGAQDSRHLGQMLLQAAERIEEEND